MYDRFWLRHKVIQIKPGSRLKFEEDPKAWELDRLQIGLDLVCSTLDLCLNPILPIAGQIDFGFERGVEEEEVEILE